MEVGLGYKIAGMGEGGTVEPGVASGALAWLYLRQGDVQQARRMFEHLLAVDPGNSEARRGLEGCRQLEYGGGMNMNDSKRLQVLRLLLARLTGQPAPAVEMAAGLTAERAGVPDPVQRRLQLLEQMLQRVRAWRREL